MSVIDGIIPTSNLELIRDRVSAILLDEFQKQYQLRPSEADLNLQKIYLERMVPFNIGELPALNVGIELGEFSNWHQGQADADYRIFIECNVQGEADVAQDETGSANAKVRVHKLLMIARAILEDPQYRTLLFPAGKIRHRHVEGFRFAEPTDQDALNSTMARMILVVRTIETNTLLDADVKITGIDTHVTLHESAKGYYWSTELIKVMYDDGDYEEMNDEPVLYEDESNLLYE